MEKEKVLKQKTKTVPTYRLFSKTGMFQDYKSCSFCGQNQFPFKKGVCPKCSKQVGYIQYVKNPKEYVQSNYGDIRMDIEELYQGIDES